MASRSQKTPRPEFIWGFACVDPLSGEYPRVTAAEAGTIPQRMRRILREKSRNDLDTLIGAVNTLLNDQRFVRLPSLEYLELLAREKNVSDTDRDRLDELDAITTSEVQALVFATGQVAVDGLAWSHLFAALALALLDCAATTENDLSHWDANNPNYEWRILHNVSTWTSMAHEAAAFAQALEMGEAQARSRLATSQAGDAYRARLSEQNRLAALKRNAPTHKAITELTQFFIEGRFSSYRTAAYQFCKERPDLVAHLAPTNRLRTLSQGLGRQIKHLRNSPT